LPLAEHTVDTTGQILATFAIFHLAGLQFCPRIREHDHINFYGTYCFDIDAEIRRDGHRPLRIPA
jgi:TnpA family transposase